MKTHKWLLGLLVLLILLGGCISATAEVCNVDAPEATVSGFSPAIMLSGISDMVSNPLDRLVVLDGSGVYSRDLYTLEDRGKDPTSL